MVYRSVQIKRKSVFKIKEEIFFQELEFVLYDVFYCKFLQRTISSLIHNQWMFHFVLIVSIFISDMIDLVFKIYEGFLRKTVMHIHVHVQQFLPNIKQRIIDQCIQEQSSKIFGSEKLSFYQKLYMRKRSPYVDILRKRSERSSISRIRLSAHKLAIDSGRYNATLRNERYL